MAVSVDNYAIGKGIVSFKPAGVGGVYRDLGNCTTFEFTPSIEKLEHFSSREGVKTKDKTVVLSKSAQLRIVLDEWSDENIALAVLGTLDSGTGAISIFSESQVSGSVKIVGTNQVGAKKIWEFTSVDFIPSGTIGLISEEWMTIELTGEVSVVSGSFGTISDVVTV